MNLDEYNAADHCPSEFLDLFVASTTWVSGLGPDVCTVREMLERHRKAVETREDRLSPLTSSQRGSIQPYAILGFYRTRDEASMALDWVRAWDSGS